MKLAYLVSVIALLPIAATVAQEGQPGRQATSRDQLIERLKQQKVVAKAAPQQEARWDLAANSEFITFNGDSTLIPKNAILHLPEAARQNVVQAGTGKVLSWIEFSAKYPALVVRADVTLQNASGQAPLDPKLLDTAIKTKRIAVAVLNGSPISVATPPPVPKP